MGTAFEIPGSVMEALCSAGEEAGAMSLEHERLIGITEISGTEGGNPEGVAAFNAYMDAIELKGVVGGSSISFSRSYPESEFIEDIEDGTDPVLGGTVHHPDGSTTVSRVPKQLWDTPAGWLAIAPVTLKENIQKQDEVLIPDGVSSAVLGQTAAIGEAVSQPAAEMIGGMLG